MLRRAVDRAVTLPFASPNAFILGHAQKKEGREVVTISQMHHRAIVDAIANREPTRAEALARTFTAGQDQPGDGPARQTAADAGSGASLIRFPRRFEFTVGVCAGRAPRVEAETQPFLQQTAKPR